MHSWLRGPKIPPILPTSPSPFSNFVPTPFPTSLLPPTAPPPTHTQLVQPHHVLNTCGKPCPHCLFCCLVSLAEWVITPHLMCYFT